MNKTAVYFFIGFFFSFTSNCYSKVQLKEQSRPDSLSKPFNIIFLIGDGMGLSQLSSNYFYSSSEPNFSRFPVIGLSKNTIWITQNNGLCCWRYSFFNRKKTYNGAIGVDMDTNAVTTITWSDYLIKDGVQAIFQLLP